MIREGDEVEHPTFGSRVLEVTGHTALVEWDTHSVTRESERPGRTPLQRQHSHVNLDKLTLRSVTGTAGT